MRDAYDVFISVYKYHRDFKRRNVDDVQNFI